MQMSHFVTRAHNACLVTTTDQPWSSCVARKRIKEGDTMQVHYGPASGVFMAQNAQEKFVR